MRYCGVVPARGMLQLALLEEVRPPEPPIHLNAVFFEPGSAGEVTAEVLSLGDVVVALGAPITEPAEGRPARDCDALLLRRGVGPLSPDGEMRRLAEGLTSLATFDGGDIGEGGDGTEGAVPEGAYNQFPVFETNADGVFCAMQGRRLPAKRHPLGIQRRIAELEDDRVIDDGGELWHRRIEELDAAAAALCAHRYAVGHACWIGAPGEGVLVLPGSSLPDEFSSDGVLPPVERLRFSSEGRSG